MSQNRYQEDRESLKELLQQYRNLKLGRQHQFLEEESFLRIIDYFDEKDNVKEALEAVEIGLSQFPFASALMIKKADLLNVATITTTTFVCNYQSIERTFISPTSC